MLFAYCLCLLFLLGVSVVLDLTPNYMGTDPWFSAGDVGDLIEKVKVGHTHKHTVCDPWFANFKGYESETLGSKCCIN